MLPEHDLEPGDWVGWTGLVAVIGRPSGLKKNLLNCLVRHDEADVRRRTPCYLRTLLTRSCIVEAFGDRGRLVFVDYDGRDLDLPHRPRGGLDNCDAIVVVCDQADGLAGAAEAVQTLHRADAVIAENAPMLRRSSITREGQPPRLLALASAEPSCSLSAWNPSSGTRAVVDALELAGAVGELDCEVTIASTADNAGVNHALHLLVWSLVAQSAARRQRLSETGRHRLLDTSGYWQSQRKPEFARSRRRARSQDLV